MLSCTYDDDLVRTDQGWRISRRRLHAFVPGSSLSIGWMPKAPAPAIGMQLSSPGDSRAPSSGDWKRGSFM
ncbi:MAG: hypothetical protein AB7T48_01340 [Solirubrobacterales bacterium]